MVATWKNAPAVNPTSRHARACRVRTPIRIATISVDAPGGKQDGFAVGEDRNNRKIHHPERIEATTTVVCIASWRGSPPR